jgi:hypothetical protein
MLKKSIKNFFLYSIKDRIARRFGSNPLEEWFFRWLVRQNTYANSFSPKNVYFEFGVGAGTTLIHFINAAKEYCKRHRKPLSDIWIYAFDSFCGLPKKEKGDENKLWHEGAFSCSREYVESRVKRTGFPLSNISFIKGYYDKSLSQELLRELQSKNVAPSIVTIDVDYYSSTKTAIDWLLPLLQSGCVFYFDDIWSFHGHPEMGELKYIHELNLSKRGYLTPCHMYGLEHHSYIFSRCEWEWR